MSLGEQEMANFQAVGELTPTGVLRAAINVGNPVLAKAGLPGEDPSGVSVDLARELGRRLGRSVTLIPFITAAHVFEALEQDAWDVAFLANEPERAGKIAFTDPYVTIEGTHLVPASSRFKSVLDVDRPGVRVASFLNAAYDLFLQRNLKQAERVLSTTPAASMDQFLNERLDAVAGVRQALVVFAASHPGFRVLPDRFMSIGQAVATPQKRPAAAEYLRNFIADAARTGFLRAAFDRHGHADLALADHPTA